MHRKVEKKAKNLQKVTRKIRGRAQKVLRKQRIKRKKGSKIFMVFKSFVNNRLGVYVIKNFKNFDIFVDRVWVKW